MEARYLFEWLRNGLDVNFSSKSWRDLVKTLIVKILRICQYIIWSGFITDLVNNSQVLRRISFLNQSTNFQFRSQSGKTKNPSSLFLWTFPVPVNIWLFTMIFQTSGPFCSADTDIVLPIFASFTGIGHYCVEFILCFKM